MSASMVEVLATILAGHRVIELGNLQTWYCKTCGVLEDGDQENHQAEVLAANGYGKLEEAQARAYDKGYGHGRHDGEHHAPMSLSATPRPEKNRRNPYRRPE